MPIETSWQGATLGANTFTGAQTINGNVTIAGDLTGSGANRVLSGFTNTNIVAAGAFYWNSRAVFRSPADGVISVLNNAETAGARLDVSTDGQVRLHDRAGTATAVLRVGTFAAGAGETFAGTITIKDYAGNDRKVAVFA